MCRDPYQHPSSRRPLDSPTQTGEEFELTEPENDSEVPPQAQTCTACLEEPLLTCDCFTAFTSLVKGVAFLIHKPSDQKSKCRGRNRCDLSRTAHEMAQAKDVRAAFAKELSANKVVPKESPLQMLSPTLENDVICAGGRLKHSHLKPAQTKPLLLVTHTTLPRAGETPGSPPDRGSRQGSRTVDHEWQEVY